MLNIREAVKNLLPEADNVLTKKDIEKFFDDFNMFLSGTSEQNKDEEAAFRKAVYLILEKMNEDLGSTRFRVPDRTTLHRIFNKHKVVDGDKVKVSEKQFVEMLRDVINESRVTGTGGLDTFMYIFGVPITAWFVKQRVAPNSISNDVFIPGVTSATIALLALFRKL
ncbi:hypothetical protein ACFE04_012890 [Oxalis oulophora]